MSDEPREEAPAEESAAREIPEEDLDVAAAEGDDEAPEHVDDGAGAGDDESQEERPRQEVEPRRTRAQTNFGALREENRELRGRYADLERQLAEIRQAQRQPTQAELQAQERAEAEAVQMMAPHEVARYYAQKSEQRIGAELNQTRQLLWDQNDANQFDTLLAQNPAFRRYEPRVEELKKQAPGVSRRILLATAIGMQALDQAPAAQTRARNRAAASAERQTVRAPSGGRGDVQSPQQRSGFSRWERLRDVQI